MLVVKCANLHTYRSDLYPECPYCQKLEKYNKNKKIEWEGKEIEEVFRTDELYVNENKLSLGKDENGIYDPITEEERQKKMDEFISGGIEKDNHTKGKDTMFLLIIAFLAFVYLIMTFFPMGNAEM